MLCALCTQVNFCEAFCSESRVEHHSTYYGLALSASLGCDFCKVAHTAVLDTHSEELILPYQDVAQTLLEQDKVEELRPLDERSTFVIERQKIGLDRRFTPFDSGVFGVQYNRVRNDTDDVLAEVYPFISLSTQDPPNEQATNIVGRSVGQKVDMALAREWLRECRGTHTDCAPPKNLQLPSRIIHVDATDTMKLRLVRAAGKTDQYVTLSHCWGGGDSQTLCTSSKNYEEHLRDIPFESLPKTFRDAVTVTIQLGFRYLWIDSLCIIQDSVADWEQECVNMAQIYQNSTVTITGPAAANSNAGFLDRPSRAEHPAYTFSYELPEQKGTSQMLVSYIGHQRGCVASPEPEPHSAISKRGWILQERLLSRRILYFGSRQIYWECLTNVRYERLHFPFVDDYQTRNEVEKISFNSSQDKSEWLQYWYRILDSYFNADLTYGSDKFPALSGIVKKMQSLLGYEYLAGLWREDLARGLSWYRSYSVKNENGLPRVLDHTAPSWSWASQPGPLSQSGLNVNETFITTDFDLLDVHVEAKGQDPFGAVKMGCLKIYGKTRTGIVRKLPHHLREGETGLYLCQGCLDVSRIGEFHPDDTEVARKMLLFTLGFREENTKPVQRQYLFLLLSLGMKFGATWVALALEPVLGTSCQYRRVGFVKDDCSDEETAKSWFKDSKPMMLELD